MTDPLIGWTTETLRFDQLLGKGGMGAVYQGVQVQMNRKVAIKVVAPHLFDDPTYRERFTREAQTLGRLVHPHIIGAHDFGPITGPDGKELFVMVLEFVNGWNLGTLLREKRLSVRQVLNLHAQAADGLAFAHSVGVIHRDIKPDNLMVTRKGVCKLADFGLARAEDSVQVTSTGAIIGSPAYMSPEACRGDPPTSASDVYSLGCSLYQALTDHMPYPGNQSLAVLQAHISQPVPTLTLHRPDLAKLDLLVQRILAKKPGDRPTAAELVKLLKEQAEQAPETLLAGRLKSATQKSKTGTVHTEVSRGIAIRSRRRRWPWWLLGILGGTLLVAAGGIAYRQLRRPATTVAPEPAVTAPEMPGEKSPAAGESTSVGEPRAVAPERSGAVAAPVNKESPAAPPSAGKAPAGVNPDFVTQQLDRVEGLLAPGTTPKDSMRRFLEARIILEDIPRIWPGELTPGQSQRLADLRRRMDQAKRQYLADHKGQDLERIRQLERAALEKAAQEKAAQDKGAAGTQQPRPSVPAP